MLEKIIYYNHKGETLCFGSDGLYANENDLRDFSNKYTSKNGKIVAFNKGIVEKSIPIIIKADTPERAAELKNKITEFADIDISTLQPGKIVINDYYMHGYLCENVKNNYLINDTYVECKLKFVTDNPYWIKETTYQYLAEPPEAVKYTDLETGIMFPEFPFDFAPVRGEKILENPSFADSNFIMTIYGFAESPQVSIAGHPYRVETTVYEGERLIIDSKKGTVKKIGRLGEVVDCYNARQKDYSVFEKIPAGLNVFQWSGGFGIYITLFDERSEPKWSL